MEQDENGLSRVAIGAAIEVHRELGGPGLLEAVYEEAFCYELSSRKIPVQRQIRVPIVYKGVVLRRHLVIDVLVGGKLIVEVKAVERYNTLFEAQLLTYLRLTQTRLGLVINFGDRLLKDGVHRVVNNL